VLNTPIRNGLLSICFWWSDGRWCRGTTDTADELDEPLPAVCAPDKTVQTMISQTGPDTEDHCRRMLTAASKHTATHDDVAAIFANHPNADINQLGQAGLLAL
jgi:hypothetical protein